MPSGKLKPASEHFLAAKIRDAIGAGPDEDVEIVTPQFTRPPGDPEPAAPPSTREEWEALSSATRQELRERGLCCWGGFFWNGGWQETEEQAAATHEVWLFPGEWYSSVPEGFPIVNIFNVDGQFQRDVTDDDIRFGCLSFGVRIQVNK